MRFSLHNACLTVVAAAALIAPAVGAPTDSTAPGFPIITSLSHEQIGAEAETYCSAQAANGTLYFGGRSLLSFDGDRWTSTAISQIAWISGLDFGPDGRLWAAAEGDIGWFQPTPAGGFTFHSLLKHLRPADQPRGAVLQVFSEGTGAIFVSTDHVYRWNGDKFDVWAMPGVRRLNAFRINGSVYVHYRRQGLFLIAPSGPKLVVPQRLIGDENRGAVLWIDAQPGGWVLATGNGLVRLHDNRSEPIAPEVSTYLRDMAVTCGVRLPDGRYAFGTLRGGLIFMRADGTSDGTLGEADGLGTSYITSLRVDAEGNLWATSPSSVFRIGLDPTSRVFDERAGLPPQLYYGITRANDRISVFNTAGVLTLADDRHFERIPLFGGGVHEITSAPDGLIVAGYRGIWRVAGTSIAPIRTTIHDVQTVLSSRVNPGELLLGEDPDPSVLALSASGDTRVVVRNLRAAATSLAEDNDGGLWIGTASQGAYFARRNPTSAVDATPAENAFGLPALKGGTNVCATAAGDVLLFAADAAWIKAAGQTSFRPVEHFPGRPVAAVAVSPQGNGLWVVHPASNQLAATVAEIVIDGANARWLPHSATGLDVIGAPRSIFAEAEGSATVLWIGGSRGLLRHVVAHGPWAPRPLPPLLRATARTPRSANPQPINAALPYSTTAIEFEFAEPEFSRRSSLRLQTRIEGVDSDWVPARADSRRELTAIRDGRYVFQVRAVAETGVASQPTTFEFVVAPPWWRTPPAFVLGFAILVPLAYGAYRLRVRTLRRRNVELEEKVRQRTEELAEASAAKTLFVANMSHDIRNPLNGIVGLALALEQTRIDPQQREIIATLRECTTYLSSLVDDVLDFASIEAGRVELRPGPFVPAELLNSVVTTLKAETARRGAFITIETDPDIPRILRADAGRIQQILVNYVSNALKYAGGHIRLAATIPAGSAGEIEFSVADEGPGISEAEQAALFNKFSRLDGARREHIPGTGLGLASCRILADIMGGSVGVESRVGAGSRFYLRLPLVEAVEPAPVPADVALPRTSILLVEDTDYNALAATAVLAKLGLTCERARTGAEALRLFGEKRHNVVLLDRNLPDMDGNDVARQMRELETDGLRSLILAVTAYCTEADRARCLEAGMDAFVGKPLTPDKLRKVLIAAGRRLLSTASVDAPTAPSAAFNTTLLEYLSDGSETGIAEQAERFLSALGEAEAQLNTATTDDTAQAVANAAHRVLGHARMVGATRLVDACVRLETAARASDAEAITRELPAVHAEIAALTAAMRGHRSAARKA